MPGEMAIPEELISLRMSIDNIDAALVYLLAERFKCTRMVGKLKAVVGIAGSRSSQRG
jgi:chorismate mutase